MKKRWLIFTIVCLGFSSLVYGYSGGDGTELNPYQVSNKDDLNFLSATSGDWDKYFLLTTDIDLAGQTNASAIISTFYGTFDGSGHVISNMTIESYSSNVGFIGRLEGGTIRNLGLVNATVYGGAYYDYRGVICGYNSYGTIKRCFATGMVSGDDYIGGVCGNNYGGLSDCYADVAVSGDGYIGGFCGRSSGVVEDSYSLGSVSGSYYHGGFSGYCYGSFDNCYWDMDSSGIFSSYGGIGLSTAQMQSSAIFMNAGWDFAFAWYMDGYPHLRFFSPGLPAVTSIVLTGSSSVLEANIWKYECLALSDDGSTNSISGSCEWSVDYPELYLAGDGYLVIPELLSNTTVEVTAECEGFESSMLVFVEKQSGTYSGGSGTEEDPFLIETLDDLMSLSHNTLHYDCHFMLNADIDLSGIVFEHALIAAWYDNIWEFGEGGYEFTGTFDGNGHVISNMTIEAPESSNDYLGLFGVVSGMDALIRNFGVVDFAIKAYGNEAKYLGGLCGENAGGVLENCYAIGQIANTEGESVEPSSLVGTLQCGVPDEPDPDYKSMLIGGLCGLNCGFIDECFAETDIFCGMDTECVGGLCGKTTGPEWCDQHSFIFNSYSRGSVIIDEYGYKVGGLCGHSGGIILRCYSTTELINGEDCDRVGGLVGSAGPDNITRNSFWDMDVSSISNSPAGTGLSTAELQTQSTFTDEGWDFMYESENGLWDTWYMNGYPELAFFREYNLVVNSGDGGGVYRSDSIIDISADAAAPGYVFNAWNVLPANYSDYLLSDTSSETSFLIPQDDVEITANYVRIPVSLSITGPSSVGERATVLLSCEANYISGPSVDVTQQAEWSIVPPDAASINEVGELTAFGTTSNLTLTITAQYVEHGVTNSTSVQIPIVNNTYGGGSGTSVDPYQLHTKEDFLSFASATADYDMNFKLYADIDLAGESFSRAVIAPNAAAGTTYTGTPFTGFLDGNGFIVRNVSIVVGSNEAWLGLFGKLSGAEIYDLGVENVVFVDASNSSRYIGGFAGQNSGSSLNSCFVGGVNIQGGSYVGGFIGLNSYNGTVSNCFSEGVLEGSSYVGGFCGYNYNSSSMEGCYASCEIISGGTKGGFCAGADGTSSATGCFWDTDLSGLTASSGGTGRTTTQMQSKSTFTDAGWDFFPSQTDGTWDIWYIYGDYPRLTSFNHAFAGSIEVRGPDTVREGEVNTFTCEAAFMDGGSGDISGQVTWSVEVLPGVTISPSGELHVSSLSSNLTVTVYAEYTVGGIAVVDSKNITVENGLYSDGLGTEESPWLILTKQDLLNLAAAPEDYSGTFALGADIDLTGELFTGAVIASEQMASFSGVFDGNGYSVKNLQIAADDPGSDYLGLFGRVEGSGSCIRNLSVIGAAINGGAESECVGALCGFSEAVVSNCSVSVDISAGASSAFVGAVCGLNAGALIDCYAKGMLVAGDSVGGICGGNDWGIIERSASLVVIEAYGSAGGVCGYNLSGDILCCFAVASIQGADTVGGICGGNAYGLIANSYSRGEVRCDGALSAGGGICGRNLFGSVDKCYSTGPVTGLALIGGVCGENLGDVFGSFWDTQASGVDVSDGGTGLITAEMQQQITYEFEGWDFTGESANGTADLWSMDDYPVLAGVDFPALSVTGFADWLSAEGVPVALSSATASPMEDGIPNLLKYACGLSPLLSYSGTDLYTMSLDDPGWFSITYFSSKQASDVTLEAVWASSLAGPWMNTGITYELLSDDGVREEWKASIPIGTSGFMRLRATLTE